MPKFCPTCGKPLEFENAEICPSCGVRIQAPQTPAEIRNPFLAIVLSFFFAGWGQWYNGKTWDGLKFFGAFLGSYLLMTIFSIMVSIEAFAGIFVILLFVVIIGIWVYGMYDAYKTAERINKREESFSKKSELFWLPVVLLAFAVLLITAAVIAAFVFGMAGSTQKSYETVPTVTIPAIKTISYPVAVPTVTSARIQPIVPAPTVIKSTGNPGWVRYTSYSDHFSIYKPSDWTVKELPKSQISQDSNLDSSLIMDKFVYIFSPNMKGFVMIYGVDASGTLYAIFNDPGKTQISDTLYDQFVNGLPAGFTDSNPVKLTGVIKDSNYYSINGYPARKVTLNTQVNGQSLNGDFYLIAYENKYYIEGYFAMVGSTQADASTASGILRTFIIN